MTNPIDNMREYVKREGPSILAEIKANRARLGPSSATRRRKRICAAASPNVWTPY